MMLRPAPCVNTPVTPDRCTRSPPELAAWRGDPGGCSPLRPGSQHGGALHRGWDGGGRTARRRTGAAHGRTGRDGVAVAARGQASRPEPGLAGGRAGVPGEERRGWSDAGQDPGLVASPRGDRALPDAAPLCAAEFDYGRRKSTVRVADGAPWQEVQVDFGRIGLVADQLRQRRRLATACGRCWPLRPLGSEARPC